MKCTNRRKIHKRIAAVLVIAVMAMGLSGCGGSKYTMPYRADSEVSSFNVMTFSADDRVEPFAADLCVVKDDVIPGEEPDMSQAGSAVLFDLNSREVLYSKNAHERMYPASLTKVMTALVALKNASVDQVLTANEKVVVTESGAQLCGIKKGDTMTLDQALHVLLINSANDAALLIAENIGGSTEAFVEMMNEEAKRLGATNTHFANPHGLTDETHYTTAYDMYLIFNEAIKYEAFNEIIHTSNYQTTYYDRNGKAKELNLRNTNGFLNGNVQSPENITVIGGKTGTTNAAGHCLILLSKDVNGAPYISVILRCETGDALYSEMSDLLEEIKK
ncbi:MAG: D-alanyl-D-alanine carboxypeptidase [Lachnospiraceae bacterium]|nr:D-alanyl-D-alanine carboxypeptidase [Lachnospiraceae bacterium]